MRKALLLIQFLMLFCICCYAQPVDVIIKPLTGYFLADRTALGKGMNYFVITKENQFNKTFGMAKTMSNRIDRPDFKKGMVITLALPETKRETTIEYISAVKAGNFIEVYYKVKRSYPITYTIQPLALALVPKYPGVNTIKFYEGKKLVRVEKIK
jgi:hypothetical protein